MKIWTEIDEKRLAQNFAALKNVISGLNGIPDRDPDGRPDASLKDETALLPVVKANAYGHGIDPCARILASAGAEWLGVTDAGEGARTRAALDAAHILRKHQPQVLVMSGTAALPGEAKTMIQERLTPVVWTAEQLARVSDAAQASGVDEPIAVHIEVDSGMSRQGVKAGPDLEKLLEHIGAMLTVRLGGMLTHFASTEIAHASQTATQRSSFEAAMTQVRNHRLTPDWVHVGNSSFIDNQDGEDGLAWLRNVAEQAGARPMVRSGLALYGHVLPIEGAGTAAARNRIVPVMSWKTRILAVSDAPEGALIGYNGTFRAERQMRLALLPVGYADGLRRELSSTNERTGGWVMVRGQRAPIVGRVSMNLTTVDVSEIANAAAGDEVVLLGDGVSAEDHARLAGTIAYDILCAIKI